MDRDPYLYLRWPGTVWLIGNASCTAVIPKALAKQYEIDQPNVAGREFEIKTDKGSGHSTLPPSTHRDDSEITYTHVGGEDQIEILDELYDILSELLKGCLVKKNKTNFNYNSRQLLI